MQTRSKPNLDQRISDAHGAIGREIAVSAAIACGISERCPHNPQAAKKGRFFRKGQWRVCWTCRKQFFAECQDGEHIRQEEGQCSCRFHECQECEETRVSEHQSRAVILRRRNGQTIAVAKNGSQPSPSSDGRTVRMDGPVSERGRKLSPR